MEVIFYAGWTGLFLLERGQKSKGEQNFRGAVNKSGSSSPAWVKEKEKKGPDLDFFYSLTFQTQDFLF